MTRSRAGGGGSTSLQLAGERTSSASTAAASVMLYVASPYFFCGVVLTANVVTRAAPILRYMLGWNEARVRAYAARREWVVNP